MELYYIYSQFCYSATCVSKITDMQNCAIKTTELMREKKGSVIHFFKKGRNLRKIAQFYTC